jgi:uncharacterized membrane-anchored protein
MNSSRTEPSSHTELFSKVPAITLAFWITKILATTLGETGGDTLSMQFGLGYAASTAIFAVLFAAAVAVQMLARRFHPVVYWTTIVATTTVGTTLADFADRSLGIGYAGGSAILLTLLVASLWLWHLTLGSISVDSVRTSGAEAFYWITIMFSQTLGTALGDWFADSLDLGYAGAAAVFGSALALIALAHYRTRISPTVLFWAAFILTRPLGAVVGDLLDKPATQGGLALSRLAASAVLLVLIAVCVAFLPHRAAHAHPRGRSGEPRRGGSTWSNARRERRRRAIAAVRLSDS